MDCLFCRAIRKRTVFQWPHACHQKANLWMDWSKGHMILLGFSFFLFFFKFLSFILQWSFWINLDTFAYPMIDSLISNNNLLHLYSSPFISCPIGWHQVCTLLKESHCNRLAAWWKPPSHRTINTPTSITWQTPWETGIKTKTKPHLAKAFGPAQSNNKEICFRENKDGRKMKLFHVL